MSIEAMKQWAEDVSKAYDVLAFGNTERALEILSNARTSLRQAIAEAEKQEQGEPVAWIDNSGHPKHMSHVQSISERKLYGARRPLYEAPQQRTWVGLTFEERDHLWEVSRAGLPRYNTFAGLVESKLREKNT
jgi:hypothetical protein